jgi:hypothetical protein
MKKMKQNKRIEAAIAIRNVRSSITPAALLLGEAEDREKAVRIIADDRSEGAKYRT